MPAMRPRVLLAAAAFASGALACAYPGRVPSADPPAAAVAHAPATPASAAASAAAAAPASSPAAGVDFATQVRPILEARCQPCHFPGGKMYASLPFDRAETVLTLREKLFTRIKEEDEQRLLREFLAQHPAASEVPAASATPAIPANTSARPAGS